MEIKVLGPGCAKCKEAERLVCEVVRETGINASVEKISDLQKIAGYGVFSTPAIVIDDDVKVVGKVPTKNELLSWIKA